MKKSLFSRGLYNETLRRLRVFGIIALAIMLTIQLAPIIINLVDYYSFSEYSYAQADGAPPVTPEPVTVNASVLFISVPFTVTIATPIMVLIAFSVFNKRSASDFYHSLPYTRTCIFTSIMAAIFTWIIGICIICSTVGLISCIAFKNVFIVILDGAFNLILTYLALLLLTAGGTALAMSATGTTLSNICVTVLILFLPRFIINIMTSWITSNATFLVFNQTGTSFFSSEINVLYGTVSYLLTSGEIPDYFSNIAADIYSIVLGLAYLALALLVFIGRKSETATCPAPGRAVQHVIRILLTMVIAIFSVILFIEHEWGGFIIISLLSGIVYFAYELITTHRWKNCLRALPFLGVVVGLCIICGATIVFVPRIAASYTPEPEDIDSVRLISNVRSGNDGWFGAEAKEMELDDKVIIKTVSETLKENMEIYKKNGYISESFLFDYTEDKYSYEQLEVVYQIVAIKEGPITRYREITFRLQDYNEILNALENNEKYTESCKTLPKPASNSIDFNIYNTEIEYSYCEKVFNSLQKEVKKLSFEDWYNIINNDYLIFSEYRIYYDTDEYNSRFVSIPISARFFPETFEMLLKAENENWEQNYLEMTPLIMEDDLTVDEEYAYVSLEVIVLRTNENGEAEYYTAQIDNHTAGWESHIYREAFKDMINKVEHCDKEPDSKNYIHVNYNHESEDDYVAGSIFLPLPDDFDPLEWEFPIMMTIRHND